MCTDPCGAGERGLETPVDSSSEGAGFCVEIERNPAFVAELLVVTRSRQEHLELVRQGNCVFLVIRWPTYVFVHKFKSSQSALCGQSGTSDT